jgi:hypothetical protein
MQAVIFVAGEQRPCVVAESDQVPRVRWSIPGVGELRPCIDRVQILSTRPVGFLNHVLKSELRLQEVGHSVNVVTYKGDHPRFQSDVPVVCAQNHAPLQLLADHEAELGHYSIITVEVAFDVIGGVAGSAPEGQRAAIGQIRKPRHRRRYLQSVHKPNQAPRRGCVPEPTFYYEERGAGVGLKTYVRQRKLPGGGFGDEHLRLEWTLNRKAALDRYFGGNQIGHLLQTDLNAFLERHIRLERVDHVALGYVFRGISPKRRPSAPLIEPDGNGLSIRDHYRDREYRARRVAFLVLRRLAYCEFKDDPEAWDRVLWTCQNSPAQIRGYLKELRDGGRRRGRGRPRHVPPGVRLINDYLIEQCFKPITLVPV